MIILNDKRNENAVKFMDLKVGDLFLYADYGKAKHGLEGVFIKTSNEHGNGEYTSVDLNSGNVYQFRSDTKVVRINRAEINLFE